MERKPFPRGTVTKSVFWVLGPTEESDGVQEGSRSWCVFGVVVCLFRFVVPTLGFSEVSVVDLEEDSW